MGIKMANQSDELLGTEIDHLDTPIGLYISTCKNYGKQFGY